MFKLVREELRLVERRSREASERSGHPAKERVSRRVHALMTGVRYASVIPTHLLISKCLENK
jgi:hypothetical protein